MFSNPRTISSNKWGRSFFEIDFLGSGKKFFDTTNFAKYVSSDINKLMKIWTNWWIFLFLFFLLFLISVRFVLLPRKSLGNFFAYFSTMLCILLSLLFRLSEFENLSLYIIGKISFSNVSYLYSLINRLSISLSMSLIKTSSKIHLDLPKFSFSVFEFCKIRYFSFIKFIITRFL